MGLSKSKILKLISEKEMSDIAEDNVFFLVEKTPAGTGEKLGGRGAGGGSTGGVPFGNVVGNAFMAFPATKVENESFEIVKQL